VRILPAPPVISTVSQYCVGIEHRVSSSSVLASATWPAARRVIYVPMHIPWPIVVRQLFWVNGTAVSGTVDCGIYTSVAGLPVTQLTHGTATQTGTSALQASDITDYYLAPGSYFLALMIDNATATTARMTGGLGTTTWKAMGLTNETPGAGSALPGTATPVTLASNVMPLFGLTTVALI
jgi:hypothetical protein